MKSSTKGFLGGIALFIALFSVNVFSQEATLSQDKIIEIQDRLSSMSAVQLNDRKAQLLLEAEDLKDEQFTSQSPSRLKKISTRLSEIDAEFKMIRFALVGLAAGTLLANDDSRDTTHPVITLIGSATVTVERGTTYTDAGAIATEM